MELLSSDLKFDILSRLPVESLLQLRCVSKAWRDEIIDNSNFRKLHTQRFKLDSSPVGTTSVSFLNLICFNRKDYYTGEYKFHFGEYNEERDVCKVTKAINYPPIEKRDVYEVAKVINYPPIEKRKDIIVGSCNGLVCYADKDSIGRSLPIYVFNPVTREQLNLTLSRFRSNVKCTYIVDGFGYHSVTKEYKVVVIFYPNWEGVGEVVVYTLGSGRWRSIGKVPSLFNRFIDFPGVLLNGALHWYDEKGSIASFDLAAEDFHVVPAPSTFKLVPNEGYIWYELCAFRGSLCVIEHCPPDELKIWVINSTCDQCWVERLNNDTTVDYDDCTLITLTSSGRVVMRYNRKMFDVYYQQNNNTGMYGSHWNETVRHVKSFVSLKALGEDAKIIG